jgi:stage V sporulation protein AA
MDVYINLKPKATITGRKIIYLKDIADVFVSSSGGDKTENIVVYTIKDDIKKNYTISIIETVKCITNAIPSATVNNLGSTDVLIEYSPKAHKPNKIVDIIKVAIVAIVLFIGSGTAIMSFQADGELLKVMEGYYSMFYGSTEHSPLILELPYSIGLALGITVFFNHFSRSKEYKDPTPIEIQMTLYEQQTVTSMVKSINSEKS